MVLLRVSSEKSLVVQRFVMQFALSRRAVVIRTERIYVIHAQRRG